jgi:hypothetical protein
MMAVSPNSFVWYELMTTDLPAAEAFYEKVVGWRAQDSGQPDMRYTIMSAGEKMVAGVMPMPEEVCAAGGRPGWLGYIGTHDVDAATKRVSEAGGFVHRAPADIPNVGRFSVVADPQGAVFMLFTPMGGDNAPVPAATPGHVGWRELYATDWATAFDFYAAQFGWTKKDALDMGPMGVYQTFAAGGDAIGGMMNKPDGIPAPVWQFYFNVDEADSTAKRVTDNGGKVLMGPLQVPGGGWILQCMDPQGATFALVACKR